MLIGLIGKSGSGKDLLANMIVEEDSSFENMSFADPIKYMAAKLTGTSGYLWHDQDFKNKELGEGWYGLTGREFLQRMGMALRERVHPNIWINALFSHYSDENNWVISDVRMLNEATRIKEMGGLLVKINRHTTVAEWSKLSGIDHSFGELDGAVTIKEAFIEVVRASNIKGKSKALAKMENITETQLDGYTDYDLEIVNYRLDDLRDSAKGILDLIKGIEPIFLDK